MRNKDRDRINQTIGFLWCLESMLRNNHDDVSEAILQQAEDLENIIAENDKE